MRIKSFEIKKKDIRIIAAVATSFTKVNSLLTIAIVSLAKVFV